MKGTAQVIESSLEDQDQESASPNKIILKKIEEEKIYESFFLENNVRVFSRKIEPSQKVGLGRYQIKNNKSKLYFTKGVIKKIEEILSKHLQKEVEIKQKGKIIPQIGSYIKLLEDPENKNKILEEINSRTKILSKKDFVLDRFNSVNCLSNLKVLKEFYQLEILYYQIEEEIQEEIISKDIIKIEKEVEKSSGIRSFEKANPKMITFIKKMKRFDLLKELRKKERIAAIKEEYSAQIPLFDVKNKLKVSNPSLMGKILRNGLYPEFCQDFDNYYKNKDNNKKGELGEKFFLEQASNFLKEKKYKYPLNYVNKPEDKDFYENHYGCNLFGFAKQSSLRGDFHILNSEGHLVTVDVKNYKKAVFSGRVKTSDINLKKMILSGLFFDLLNVSKEVETKLSLVCQQKYLSLFKDEENLTFYVSKDSFLNFLIVQEMGLFFYNKQEFPEKSFLYLDLENNLMNLAQLTFDNITDSKIKVEVSIISPRVNNKRSNIKVLFSQDGEKLYMGETRSFKNELKADNAYCYPLLLDHNCFNNVNDVMNKILKIKKRGK